MARYIDADAFEVFGYNVPKEYDVESFGAGVACVLDKLDKQPTVDVVEVLHGKWIEEVDDMGGYEDYYPINYYCSKCEYLSKDGKTNYCPNCGAKMDKGGDAK